MCKRLFYQNHLCYQQSRQHYVSICSCIKQDHTRASAVHAPAHISHFKLWRSKTDHDGAEDLHWLGAKSGKASQDVWEGKGLRSLSLSLPVKQQQPNKSKTYGMTNSRLWHPSDPKHVLIISPWLPVGVYVISAHIPTDKISIQTVAWNRSDSGLRGLEWSNKSYERIQLELPCSHCYTVFTALLCKDKHLSSIRCTTFYLFCILIKCEWTVKVMWFICSAAKIPSISQRRK